MWSVSGGFAGFSRLAGMMTTRGCYLLLSSAVIPQAVCDLRGGQVTHVPATRLVR